MFCVLTSCERSQQPRQPPLFELLKPEATGITFSNTLPEKPDFNILNYLYYYNGAGVAVGDIDGDGLPDLYFTSNLGPNKLYRNLGNYRFEDITEKAGVADSIGWKTGVTMADVNGDGLVDIYVSGVDYLGEHGRNVLYINNGDGTFTDRTREYGFEHVGYSTQALFFTVTATSTCTCSTTRRTPSAESRRGRNRAIAVRAPATDCSATTATTSPTSPTPPGSTTE
ncbi:MAG: hypothetical protein DMD72_03415 [Gemmatimonadetes bacterium]|nr:MAG: hypothetical protein DMD72_03415 [Gemmatimonadota bacterium]